MSNKKKDKTGLPLTLIFTLFFLLCVLIFFSVEAIKDFNDNNICKSNGYEYFKNIDVQDGYVRCCNDYYDSEHIQQQKCETIKKIK